MFGAITRTLYGELPPEKFCEALTFSLLLCFVVGIYWMMRSLKDSVFATLVGLEYQPQAKMLSLFVVTAVLFAYNKVVDLVERNRLFAVICGSYALVFVATDQATGEKRALKRVRCQSREQHQAADARRQLDDRVAAHIEHARANENVLLALTSHGGHLGWCEREDSEQGGASKLQWGGPAWVEKVSCGFLEAALEITPSDGCDQIACEIFYDD